MTPHDQQLFHGGPGQACLISSRKKKMAKVSWGGSVLGVQGNEGDCSWDWAGAASQGSCNFVPCCWTMLGILGAAAASPQGGQKGRDWEGGISHWKKLKGRQCPNWDEPKLGAGRDQARIGASPWLTTGGIQLMTPMRSH